jgi:hypothetical protein
LVSNSVDVDQGPHPLDAPVLEAVEDVLSEHYASAGGRDASELMFGGAVKPQAAGDDIVAGDALVDGEVQVRDLPHVLGDHLGVLLPGDRRIVVDDLVVDVLIKLVQPPTVQDIEVGAISLFEVVAQGLFLVISVVAQLSPPNLAGQLPSYRRVIDQ